MRLPTPHLPQDPHPAITRSQLATDPANGTPAQRLSRQRFSALARNGCAGLSPNISVVGGQPAVPAVVRDLLSLTQSRSSRSTYVTYSNIRGSHGLVLRRLRRRGRSLISGGMVLWMKDSTAPMSASLRLPRYACITFRRHHLLVGRPPRRKCQEQRSRLIERSWPCSPPND